MSELFNKILKAIPLHVGEVYLDPEIREEIAASVDNSLNNNCEHDWKTMPQVRIIEPHVCKKCGKLK